MKHSTYLIASMVLMLFIVGQTAQGAVLSSCDQWGNYCSGAYCVYNNVWGATGSWSQCITANSTTQWTVTATHPGDGIKSYPNSSYENVGQSISAASISSSVSASPPSGGTYNLSYDIWAPSEVMIWLKWQGAIGPWGSYVTSATIDGRGWDVYKNGYPGYLAQSQMSGGTFNIKAFLQDSVNRGWLSSGNTVGKVQCGYEIVAASNTTFGMNSYSVTVGGASTSTTAASTTTTAASTSTTSASTSTTAASTTTTAASTTTTSGGSGSCTCDTGCNGSSKSVPFSQDGAGEYCWYTTSLSSVNSWNTVKVEVNDQDCTNKWANSFPAKINGNYYIYYKATLSYGHFEAN